MADTSKEKDMDRQSAAVLLGVPPREVRAVDEHTITTRDGAIYEVPDEGAVVDRWVRTNPGKTPVRYHAMVVEPVPAGDELAEDVDGDGVPDGTAQQILEWVGEDSERARAALAAEQARGATARKSLVSALEKLAG